MQKNRSIQNALNETNDSEGEGDSYKEPIHEREPTEEKEEMSDGDLIEVLLRGFTAFFMAVFFGAVISGMMEVSQGWEITFGSLPMMAITAVLYYPSYKILAWLGFFRKKPVDIQK